MSFIALLRPICTNCWRQCWRLVRISL